SVSERDETGAVLWRYDIPGPTTLIDESPQRVLLSTKERSCLLITVCNYGTTLERLDDGRLRWPRPAVFRSCGGWGPGIAHDATAVYVGHEGRLTALSLEDGKRLWDHPLADAPAGDWQTMRVGDYLLAYPVPRAEVSVPVPLTFGLLECGPLSPDGH